MIEELFDVDAGVPDYAPVEVYRKALERAVTEAKREAEWHYKALDEAEVKRIFEELASDGDEGWALAEIRECVDLDITGGGAAWDAMREHVGKVRAAWEELAKAERRGR